MEEREDIFRDVVIRNKSNYLLASPIVFQEKLLSVHSWALTGLLLSLLLVLALLRYTQTESAPGILAHIHGGEEVVSPVAATMAEILVGEGQAVSEGDILAKLSTATFDHAGRSANEQRISRLSAQQSLLNEQLDIHYRRERDFDDFSGQVQQSLVSGIAIGDEDEVILDRQLRSSTRNLRSLAVLLRNESMSQSQFDQQEQTHLVLMRQHQQLQLRQSERSNDLDTLAAQFSEKELQLRLTKLELIDRLDQLNYEMDKLKHGNEITVVARTDGKVATINVRQGEMLHPGQPLMQINSLNPALEAVIYVPSRVYGKLSVGQEVMLSYDAFDYRYIGRASAIVRQISRATLDPREQLIPVVGIEHAVFKVVAEIDKHYVEGAETVPLHAGMLFKAEFVLGEKTLLGYIFEPMLRLRGKVG